LKYPVNPNFLLNPKPQEEKKKGGVIVPSIRELKSGRNIEGKKKRLIIFKVPPLNQKKKNHTAPRDILAALGTGEEKERERFIRGARGKGEKKGPKKERGGKRAGAAQAPSVRGVKGKKGGCRKKRKKKGC